MSPRRPAAVRHFYTKVVGVTFDHDDGTSRQTIIGKLDVMGRLDLQRDEDNRYDLNAVKVCRLSGEQIGHLARELAAEVVDKAKRGYRYAAFVRSVGSGDDEVLGPKLIMLVAAPGVTDAEVRDYLNGGMVPEARGPQEKDVAPVPPAVRQHAPHGPSSAPAGRSPARRPEVAPAVANHRGNDRRRRAASPMARQIGGRSPRRPRSLRLPS